LPTRSRFTTKTFRIASSIAVLVAAFAGPMFGSAGAFAGPIPLGGSPGKQISASSPSRSQSMFGPLGVEITTVAKALRFTTPGRGAFRVDIPMMSSSAPIRYKTTFSASKSVDLAGMKAAGIKLVLTVRNGPSGIDLPLPDDGSMDTAFQTALGTMIDQLKPDYVVYGNEVNSRDKYTGTVAQFQRIMTLGHAVAAAKGVKDGGTALMGNVTSHATYLDILATQGQSAATTFKSDAQMAPFNRSMADQANAFIDATKAAGVDFFVWHSYFGNPSGILQMKTYVEKRFGGPSFINELGWRTGSAQTGTAIIDALQGAGMPIVLIYGSGRGQNAPDKLWNSDGTPTAEGAVISAHLLGL
jgi:hypothetical protein